MSNRGSLLPIQRFSPCEKNSMSSSELLSAEQVGWLDNMTSGLPYQLEHRSRCPLEQECEACNISSEIIQSFNLLDPNEVERRSEEVDSLANQVVTATFRNTICIRIPKKMMDEMGIEIPLVMKYYSFFARRLLQIASHCSIHVDEHAQLILSEDIIIHLEPLKCSSCDGNEFNQTVNQTEELGWFRCILDEDYSRPILMTERKPSSLLKTLILEI